MRNSVTNSDGYCDTYTNRDACAKGYSDAETSADSPPAPVAGNTDSQ